MLKTYTVKIVLQEGDDEFWESLQGKSGCDEVVQAIKTCLSMYGFDLTAEITLDKFAVEEPRG